MMMVHVPLGPSYSPDSFSLGVDAAPPRASLWSSSLIILSKLAGLLDLVAVRLSPDVFLADGMGDDVVYAKAFALGLEKGPNVAPAELTIEREVAAAHDGGIATAVVSFRSPVADLLEEEAKTARAEIVAPVTGPPPQRLEDLVAGADVVIHCPMTGDIGFSFRRRSYALPLATSTGAVSIILQIAFYGPRRPASMGGRYGLPTVAHVASQGAAVFTEARALAEWARAAGSRTITYAGVSFGGAMASMAALLDPQSHAVISTVGTHSPAPPFSQGLLAQTVDWPAIGGRYGPVGRALWAISTDAIPAPSTSTSCKRIARILYAADDKYIPREASASLYDALGASSATVSLTRAAMPGGHGWAIMCARRRHVAAIVDAVAAQLQLVD
ncbi:uncharacterized protein AMSG_06609 [Thecamonas trahens ATCC 50062]|uniref:Uncharacterized protein n=1 Tax=Thecamonas trahens ATCC 50062 TaxID=461836 RepID=A0A0L0DES5_THETB|nr:hypothetical protein AMSG_06609 [Thecamonas trahens ATCC 50062]KNC50720.1 hypothetical protein AMSG_06609 [Thecamonas trahens ATCC 50062]|eukprot:XP_013756689.1 hypothetical protein AMSG_06609 [Thecamonas trahens ATCC 50062]